MTTEEIPDAADLDMRNPETYGRMQNAAGAVGRWGGIAGIFITFGKTARNFEN